MVHHDKPNTLAGLWKLSKAIDAWYWERNENSPTKPKFPDLLETSLNTSLTTSPAKVLPIPSRRTTTLLYPGQGLLFWQKSPPLQPFFETWERCKANSTEHQCHLDTSFASFVAPLDMSPRMSKIQLGFRQSPSVQVWSDNLHLLAQIRKKDWAVLRLHMTRGLCWTLLCETLTLNASSLSNPHSLTLFLTSDTLPDMVLKSLWIPIFRLFHWSVFVQTQHLPAYGILPIKLWLIDRTSNSIILQALDLQIHFPTRKSQTLTFYITPLDQSCTIVLGYCWLTHYNPLVDWVLGSIFFWQLSQHESKSSPSVKTLTSSAPLPRLLDLSQIFWNLFHW